MEVIRHATLEDALRVHFPDGLPDDGVWEWQDEDGTHHEMGWEESVETLYIRGYWGFVENKEVLHVWFEDWVPDRSLIRLLAHEIGHTRRPHHRDLREEQKANRYGNVAQEAFDLMIKLRT